MIFRAWSAVSNIMRSSFREMSPRLVHTELVVARRVRIAVHAVMAVENALQCQNGNNAIQDQKRFMHWVRDA
jgi:hypothetical protein